MGEHKFVGIVGILVIIIFIIYNHMSYRKKEQKTIIKSLGNSNEPLIVLGAIWFLLSLSQVRLFYKYKAGNLDLEFKYIYTAILDALVGLGLILRSFYRDIINEDGIYTSKGYYKWERIVNYEWGIEDQMKVKKEYIKYNNLTFFISRTKFDRFFTGVNDKQVIFRINKDSKGKAQSFLKDVQNLKEKSRKNDI